MFSHAHVRLFLPVYFVAAVSSMQAHLPTKRGFSYFFTGHSKSNGNLYVKCACDVVLFQ